MDDFKGKVAVITGAGSGFGREFARIGASLGMKLVLADMQADALDETRAELDAQGAEVLRARWTSPMARRSRRWPRRPCARFGARAPAVQQRRRRRGRPDLGKHVRDWEWVLGVNLWGVDPWRARFHAADAGCRARQTPLIAATSSTPPRWRACSNPPQWGPTTSPSTRWCRCRETLFQDLSLVTEQVALLGAVPVFRAYRHPPVASQSPGRSGQCDPGHPLATDRPGHDQQSGHLGKTHRRGYRRTHVRCDKERFLLHRLASGCAGGRPPAGRRHHGVAQPDRSFAHKPELRRNWRRRSGVRDLQPSRIILLVTGSTVPARDRAFVEPALSGSTQS